MAFKWADKFKENVVTVALTTVVALLTWGGSMLLDHDKKLALIDQKLSILIHVVAPNLDIDKMAKMPAPPRALVPPQADIDPAITRIDIQH